MTGPREAMVMAAGLGTRMRPLTDDRPKPLIKVAGKAMIDHQLDGLAAGGVSRAIVNVHYKAEMIRAHLASRTTPEIVISDETDRLLDTGGGVTKALPHFTDDCFFVVNGDSLWGRGFPAALQRLSDYWIPDELDALLLLVPLSQAVGFDGKGDFDLGPGSVPIRRGTSPMAPFAYVGLQIVHRRLFAHCAIEPFSTNMMWDRALAAERLHAVVHDDIWYHVGTPEALTMTNAAFAQTVST